MAGIADEHVLSSRPPHSLRIDVDRPVTWQRSEAIWPTLAGDSPPSVAIAVGQLFINPYRILNLPLVVNR